MRPVFIVDGEPVRDTRPQSPEPEAEELPPMERITREAQLEAERQSTKTRNN